MRRLFLVLALLVAAAFSIAHVGAAHAGEPNAIGTIRVSDAGSTNNAETGYGDGLAPNGSFPLGNNAPYGVQCDSPGALFAVGSRFTDAGLGLKLSTDQFIFTSTPAGGSFIPVKVDGGSYSGGLISIAPIAGQTTAICRIFNTTGP